MSEPTTMRAWRTHEWGRAEEVLKLDTIDVPEPGEGELLVRNHAIPLNLNDLDRGTGGEACGHGGEDFRRDPKPAAKLFPRRTLPERKLAMVVGEALDGRRLQRVPAGPRIEQGRFVLPDGYNRARLQ